MLPLWLIIVFMAMVLRDTTGEPLLFGRLGPLGAATTTLGVLFLIWLAAAIAMASSVRRVQRCGLPRDLINIDRWSKRGRLALVAAFVAGVLAVGWLDAVRTVVGDLVAVDELLALAPLIVMVAGWWWLVYPAERTVREAVLLRAIDDGHTVYPIPTRASWVWSNLRHQVLLALTPVLVILAWVEFLDWGLADLAGFSDGKPIGVVGDWLAQDGVADAVMAAGQLVGVGLIFTMAPIFLKFVWETQPLGAGRVRDRLLELCRQQHVKVRKLLVWRTNGSMVNGAVMGLFPQVRYILLTDALLDSMPEEQVEAVMAHELAHVRHRHVIWLLLVLITVVGLCAVAADTAFQFAGFSADQVGIELAISIVALGSGLLTFGIVSRRFEWQADAFAAQHLSGMRPDGPDDIRIDRLAVEAMAGALATVSRLNHVPSSRKSWRHGSIALRQARLGSLVGQRVSEIPIDRVADRFKVASAMGLLVLVVLGVWEL